MALPKKRTSKSRTRRRRSHLALERIQLQPCSHCKQPSRPHHICLSCGYYANREVIKVETA
ncbi:MAG: 50S ribosomal protein L32 [Candidatus Dormibacteraceae bacterium]